LFARMQMGLECDVDPTAVLTGIIDEIGDKFKIGEE
jgi:hypothetical protein